MTFSPVALTSVFFPDGEVFGFLGPNGAGKSTTINLMLDFIRPTRGRVEVLGMDAQADPVESTVLIQVQPSPGGCKGR